MASAPSFNETVQRRWQHLPATRQLPDDQSFSVYKNAVQTRLTPHHFTRRPWLMCAMFLGVVPLSDQQSIMKKSLEMLGLQTSLNTYMAHMAGQYNSFSGKGTVFIDGRTGLTVCLC
jgi:hypothetical protein